MEQEQFVGFDVSQAETSVCVVSGAGKVVWQGAGGRERKRAGFSGRSLSGQERRSPAKRRRRVAAQA
jgi:hypothetical protein